MAVGLENAATPLNWHFVSPMRDTHGQPEHVQGPCCQLLNVFIFGARQAHAGGQRPRWRCMTEYLSPTGDLRVGQPGAGHSLAAGYLGFSVAFGPDAKYTTDFDAVFA